MEYRGPKDLTQYYIESYIIRDIPEGKHQGRPGIEVEITFRRTILNEMLTTFLPSAAVCIVSFSTNFYKVKIVNLYCFENLGSFHQFVAFSLNSFKPRSP